jgi:hypothetical protein
MGKFFRMAFAVSLTMVLVSSKILPLWADILIIMTCIGNNVSTFIDSRKGNGSRRWMPPAKSA